MPTRAERFWAKVDRRGADECWPWRASIGSHGYGAFWDGERVTTAPLFAYKLLVGPVPKGVTRGVNVLRGSSPSAVNARKTHCIRGHAFDVANTLVIIGKDGRRGRRCRTCFNAARRRRYAETCG